MYCVDIDIYADSFDILRGINSADESILYIYLIWSQNTKISAEKL